MKIRIALVLLLFSVACGPSTKMTKAWVYPEYGPLQYDSVMALLLVQDSLIRRNGEDELVQQIRQVDAVAAYTILPESDLGDEDKVRAAVAKSGVEAIIVMRPMYDEHKGARHRFANCRLNRTLSRGAKAKNTWAPFENGSWWVGGSPYFRHRLRG